MTRTWVEGNNGTEVKLLTMPGLGHAIPDFFIDLVLPFFEAHTT